jgi:hypothetical protein
MGCCASQYFVDSVRIWENENTRRLLKGLSDSGIIEIKGCADTVKGMKSHEFNDQWALEVL